MTFLRNSAAHWTIDATDRSVLIACRYCPRRFIAATASAALTQHYSHLRNSHPNLHRAHAAAAASLARLT